MSKKQKYYVVWRGIKPGVYSTWKDCEQQVKGFESALYKSFETIAEAEQAFKGSAYNHIGKSNSTSVASSVKKKVGAPIMKSISVDAAWNTATLYMEYRGVETWSKKEIFSKGPYADGTNNIGEFLAIVHALALMKQHKIDLPLYSDSKTAISWVKKKKANTKLEPTHRNKILFELIERAEKWLHENTFTTPILKWETEQWGENPADFGRK